MGLTGTKVGLVDILMITYNRPEYTRLSLNSLLESCDERTRVWIWHNGGHTETLAVVEGFLGHPRVHRFHHSPVNVKLAEPTNWMWSESEGEFLSKVDDDCLLPANWLDVLRQAHSDYPQLGIVGCWRFHDEDYLPKEAAKRIEEFGQGHYLLRNVWIEGSGYLMKRACYDDLGPLRRKHSFTDYCIQLANRGWVNGWYFPFLRQEHMDDPRSPHSLLKSDEDLVRYMPLSAKKTGARTLAEWQAQLKQSARAVQTSSLDPRQYLGWRWLARRAKGRVKRFVGRSGW